MTNTCKWPEVKCHHCCECIFFGNLHQCWATLHYIQQQLGSQKVKNLCYFYITPWCSFVLTVFKGWISLTIMHHNQEETKTFSLTRTLVPLWYRRIHWFIAGDASIFLGKPCNFSEPVTCNCERSSSFPLQHIWHFSRNILSRWLISD